ncbi:hypothetical protein Scep_015233 [Stephania cephalantha]|uniref:Uncharacterized protein n=1 Tax=Stephania cephalantha TaxID=152367 RepID=A0AAP0J2I1_9MAGN
MGNGHWLSFIRNGIGRLCKILPIENFLKSGQSKMSYTQRQMDPMMIGMGMVMGTIVKEDPLRLCSTSEDESEKESWHVPIADGSNDEAFRTWLCISRPNSHQYPPDENSTKSVAPVVNHPHCSDQPSPSVCGTETVIKENGSYGTTASTQL